MSKLKELVKYNEARKVNEGRTSEKLKEAFECIEARIK